MTEYSLNMSYIQEHTYSLRLIYPLGPIYPLDACRVIKLEHHNCLSVVHTFVFVRCFFHYVRRSNILFGQLKITFAGV
jgi:hypothetical protein